MRFGTRTAGSLTQDVSVHTGGGARFSLRRKADRFRLLSTLALSLSGDGWTYQSSVVSAVISLPAYINHLGYGSTQYIPEGPGQWIGPVYSLGQLFGGLVASWFCDRLGRKFTLLLGALMIDVSVSLMMWSPNLGVVILSRVLEGASIGFLLLGYQVYIVEMSGRSERGFLSGMSLVTGNIFSLIASAITYGITYVDGDWGWRLAYGLSYIPANLLLLVLPFVPDTPRWYYSVGREKEARETFARLQGDNDGILTEDTEREYIEMKAAIDYDRQHGLSNWKNLFSSKSARYRTYVALFSQFIWAWNGQSVTTYYFTRVFDAAGFSDVHQQFAINSIQGAMWVVGSIVGAYLLDVTGRKFSLLVGVGQMAICLFIQGGISRVYLDGKADGDVNHPAGTAFVAFYIIQWTLWVTFFSSVVNMFPAELFPAPLRAKGYALSNVISMAAGFAAQYTGLPMFTVMEGWTWIFFAFCMTFAFFIVLFTFPETKNRTLEEIELIFNSGAGGQVRRVFQGVRAERSANYDHLSNSSGGSWKKSPVVDDVFHPRQNGDVKTTGIETADEAPTVQEL